MGKYTFVWQHAASEVFVTGEFDDWSKSVQLVNEDGIFKKTVELPSRKLQYKFVVDGNWCTNDSAAKEDDGKGIFNNVLYPEDIKDEPVGTLSSAAPESSTAALAGAVPKETKKQEDVPGAFPVTPFETPATEAQGFSVNPLPATDGPGNPIKLAPGEPVPDPSTFTSNTVQSTVKDDAPEEETVSVAPLPATAGPGNPIHLAPGEKVPDPSTFTSNTVDSTVKTDAESYEKSDSQPPQLAPVVMTPEAERDAKGGMFSLPPLTGNMIPESSLPMGKDLDTKSEQDPGVTIQSAAPTSTTAALAGEVPKEPSVPVTVTESQKEAGFAPEASANPVAVEEKKELEQELKAKVPEEPATAESSSNGGIAASVLGGATIAAGTFAAATYAAKDRAATALGLNGNATSTNVGNEVPAVVTESQKEAHVDPEASANTEAVVEKSAVEQELLSEVKKTTETGEPAPAIAAATTSTPAPATASTDVPEVVTESQKEAHVSPEASANPVAVEEKKEVEQELLKEVKKATESGEPAPTITAATSATAPGLSDEALVDSTPLKSSSEPNALEAPTKSIPEPMAYTSVAPSTAKSAETETPKPVEAETSKAKELEPAPAVIDSRDVSPMSKQPTTATQTQPIVTTGVETTTTPAKSTAPTTPQKTAAPESSKDTPGSVASTATDKKSKRKSLMMKIKKVFN